MTRAEKSAEAAMRQFAAQERQAEKEKMKEWKEKVMQEMTRELHIIRQTHEEEIKAQSQGFQIELERVGGKLEQLQLRSKVLENEVKALRLPGQLATRKSPPAKAVAVSSSGNEDTRDEGQTEDPRYKERSSEHQQLVRLTSPSKPSHQPPLLVKVTHRWLPLARLRSQQKILGRKLRVAVEDEKPLHPQKLSRIKEG